MRDGAAGTLATWRLDSPGQTLAFASLDGRLPVCIHWGAPLADDEDLAALTAALAPPRTPAMLDAPMEVSLCPEAGWAFPGTPGLIGHRENGTGSAKQFQLVSVETEPGLVFHAEEAARGLALTLHIALDTATDSVTAYAELTNTGDAPYWLDWLAAPVLPLNPAAQSLIDFAGRWTREFRPETVAITQGQHVRENRRGRTAHDHFPAFIIPLPNCTHIAGEAYAVHLAWSGNHRMAVERLPDGRGQIQAGAFLEPGEIRLLPDESFKTPKIVASYSGTGLNGIMQTFHRHMRQVVGFPDPQRPRPVHFNCWEAVYFDHDVAVLKRLADRAAALGVERFVLDDGWFKGRNDDTKALGDWTVDRNKYPDGLTPLIDHVQSLGMAFGLWVEPEMVSPESDLARAHPEWLIKPEGYAEIRGRNQHLLDLTNPDVIDYLSGCLGKLLSEYPIDYLKWDMNRDLALALDASGRPLTHRQTLALYALIDRIRAAHPAVEIETCASGGARLDAEILARTHRVWLSDSNDARLRAEMQHEAMLFLPPEIVGSHVGPRRCHTSGRVLPMGFRCGVALGGHFGIEADLRELDAGESDRVRSAIAFYKGHRAWMHDGRSHRLDTSDKSRLAHMVVAEEADRFILFDAHLDVAPRTASPALRLTGLDPDRAYRLVLENPQDIDPIVCRDYASPLANDDGLVLSGRALMTAGIVLPNALPDTVWIVAGQTFN